jgi:hypothetical protein
MAKENKKEAKRPFFKNPTNYVWLAALAAMLAYMGLVKGEDGYTGLQRLFVRADSAVTSVTQGCGKPTDGQVEAHFKDKAGTVPIERDFDADKGELCGNGKEYFCTSFPLDKPIPFGWTAPPRPGSDPSYQGPDPLAPFKESPYAMPSPKVILDRKPIDDLDDDGLAGEIRAAASHGQGKIGMIAGGELRSELEPLKGELASLEAALFDGDDDEAVAKALEQKGVEFVLVDRLSPKAAPWIEEKMDTVRIRMRDAVSLGWLHPVVLGSGYALYRRAPPLDIPKHVKRRLAARARALLVGETPEQLDFEPPLEAVGEDVHRVVVSLRKRSEPEIKGRKIARRMGSDASLVAAIDEAVGKIRDDWGEIRRSTEREYGVEISADIRKEVAQMEVEIDVIHDICEIADRTPSNLLWYIELGLEGVMIRDKEGEKQVHYLEPSYATQMEVESEVQFLERAFDKNKLDMFLRAPKKEAGTKRDRVLNETEWKRDDKHIFQRFATTNWIERPQVDGGDIVELYRGVPLKTIWDVSRAALVKSLELGAGWLMTNQTPDGQYAYKYTPTNKPGKRWSEGGNIVRHALNPYTLLMVNKIKQDPRFVESAKRGIGFSLKFLRHEGMRCAICHRDPPARYYNAKLNAVAVTILSILKLGEVADISEYKDDLKCMAEEILYMQDKNGHIWQYDVPPDHPYYGAESTIQSGEFIFALARLYTHYKEERFKTACDRAIAYYIPQWRKLLGERTERGIYDEEHRVNLIGIVPWLVTAMQDLYKNTSDKKYADLAFEAQDWIDDEFFWWPRRAQYPDYVGASFKVHRELPAVNSCQYAEGASAAYDIAKRTGRDVERRRQVVVHAMRFCLQLQYDGYDSTFFLPVPSEALGAYRYTLGHLRLRNDYNYHAMAAIAQAVEYLEPEDYPAERPLRIPPTLRELLGGLPNPAKDVTREEYRAARAAKPPEAAPIQNAVAP